jgi:hypothetical protein
VKKWGNLKEKEERGKIKGTFKLQRGKFKLKV